MNITAFKERLNQVMIGKGVDDHTVIAIRNSYGELEYIQQIETVTSKHGDVTYIEIKGSQ